MSTPTPLPGSEIDTGGGAYVGGSPEVGGDFIGRDQIVHGDLVQRIKIVYAGPPPARLWVNVPPRPSQPLVGRDALLDDLVARLLAGRSPALSTDGLPGAGKTALAVALAHDARVQAHFSGGVLWGGLGTSPDPATILSQWAAAAHVELADLPDLPARVHRLSAALADHKVLVVLDDAWDAAAPKHLRLGCPQAVHLLTTRSREIARAFAGAAQQVHVPELAPDPAEALLAQLAPEACAADPAAAARLVAAVGGLPLAIELLGGYLALLERWLYPDLSAQAFAELTDPQRRLALAQARLGDTTGREQSLQEAIQLSLDDLARSSPVALSVFYALGAFAPKPATFTRLAAEEVAGAAGSTLALLAARNLVEGNADGALAIHQVMHDTAASWTTVESKEHHAEHYCWRAHMLASQIYTPPNDDQSIDLYRDMPNYFLANERLCEEKEWRHRLELLNKLHTGLANYYDRSGKWEERSRMLANAISAVPTTIDLHEQHACGELHIQLADIYRRQLGNLDRARELFESGISMLVQGEPQLYLKDYEIYRKLGDLYRARGEFREALDKYRAAEALLSSSDDPHECGKLYSSMAEAYARAGISRHRAIKYGKKSLQLQQSVQDWDEIGQSHRIMADIYLSCGILDEATTQIEKAYALYQTPERHTHPVMGWILRTKGDIHLALDEIAEARKCFMAADEIFKTGQVGVGSAIILMKRGQLQLISGSFSVARRLLDSAIQRAKSVPGARYALAEVLLARIDASRFAKRRLLRTRDLSEQERLSLTGLAENVTEFETEFRQLTEKNDDLAVWWAHYQMITTFTSVELGVADSIAAAIGFDPRATMEYANANGFGLVQVYQNQWLARDDVVDALVDKSDRYGTRLICHASGLLNRGISAETVDAAKGVLRNRAEKLVVIHFDERVSTGEALSAALGLCDAGLIPCIENYHQLEGRDAALEHYYRFHQLFAELAARQLPAYAVLDISRTFHAKLGISTQEASDLIIESFTVLRDLKIPVILHLIDSTTRSQHRNDWCRLGVGGVIPYGKLLRRMFSCEGVIRSVVFEYEDQENPVESVRYLRRCIRGGLVLRYPKLASHWPGLATFELWPIRERLLTANNIP